MGDMGSASLSHLLKGTWGLGHGVWVMGSASLSHMLKVIQSTFSLRTKTLLDNILYSIVRTCYVQYNTHYTTIARVPGTRTISNINNCAGAWHRNNLAPRQF